MRGVFTRNSFIIQIFTDTKTRCLLLLADDQVVLRGVPLEDLRAGAQQPLETGGQSQRLEVINYLKLDTFLCEFIQTKIFTVLGRV